MQITLNTIPFDVQPVPGPLRTALLADPAIERGVHRDVWAWDAETGKGRHLASVTPQQGLPLPAGIITWVSAPGTNGAGPRKAEGPSARMAERLLAAVGAKNFAQVMQALSRVTGVPQKKVPLDAFAGVNPFGSYVIRMETDFSVLELVNAGRNLAFHVFVPALVTFAHGMEDVPEGAPAPGSIRPGFVLPAGTQATMTMRRIAVTRRLSELQADLGATKPADLAPGDPRRDVVARLGAEWRLLAAQAKKKAA